MPSLGTVGSGVIGFDSLAARLLSAIFCRIDSGSFNSDR
jgi:hypothetical protein